MNQFMSRVLKLAIDQYAQLSFSGICAINGASIRISCKIRLENKKKTTLVHLRTRLTDYEKKNTPTINILVRVKCVKICIIRNSGYPCVMKWCPTITIRRPAYFSNIFQHLWKRSSFWTVGRDTHARLRV